MDIRKIRWYEGKETRVEWAENTKDETDERRRVSKQAPEQAFVDALQAFLPLLVAACGLGDVWTKSGVVTGLTFGEEKAQGGGTRLNLMIHGRCTPEGQSSPVLLNSPLMREASDENMIGKPGVIPALSLAPNSSAKGDGPLPIRPSEMQTSDISCACGATSGQTPKAVIRLIEAWFSA